jgi:shikimate kinase
MPEEEMMRFAHRGKKDEAREEALRVIRAGLGDRSIVLVGMPGSGKSAVGRRLAPHLGLPFVDADTEIEAAAGRSISDIFKEHGEPYFRDGEARVIARLLSEAPKVLSTGGGAFMTATTRERIRERAISIWLKAELPLLLRRVLKRNNRPLLANDPEGALRALMEARHPVYATADITVESRDLPHDVMIDELIENLAKSRLLAPDDRDGDAAPGNPGSAP